MIRRIRHETAFALSRVRRGFTAAMEHKRKRQRMAQWLRALRSDPPDVLAGANIDANGGVRNHLLGIRKYSALRVDLAPPDELVAELSYPDFHTVLRKQFFDFVPSAIANVHSHVYPYFIKWCLEHRDSGTRWIHTYHSPYFPTFAGDPLEPWQRDINDAVINDARHAHVRLSVSRWQQAWLRSEHGIVADYLPNGVDVDVCEQGRASHFIERTGLQNFVLYLGRNDAVKNPADFVRLAAANPGRTFVMAGQGLDAATLSSEWRVVSPSNLNFAGVLSRAEAQDALAACGALVITSLWEGLPTAALEALVHEVPVVVPDNPGCMEATGNGEFGFIYRQGDIDDLSKQMLAALQADRPTPRSKERILDEYDWRVVAAKLDAIYAGSQP